MLLHGFTSSFRGTWQASGWVTDLMAWGFRMIGLDVRGQTQCITLSGVSHTMLIGDQRLCELVRSFLLIEPDERESSCSAEESL